MWYVTVYCTFRGFYVRSTTMRSTASFFLLSRLPVSSGAGAAACNSYNVVDTAGVGPASAATATAPDGQPICVSIT